MEGVDLNKLLGVVVIGRNEGERLRCCLESVFVNAHHVVYVDSGSSDDSISIAKKLGAEIVELDMSVPFTAARARNEGFNRLNEIDDSFVFVQFLDGDCEVVEEWLGVSLCFLNEEKDVAVVCGRRRERYPNQSIYNAMCDAEWDTSVGEALACGGDAMMRVSAFEDVGGFRDDLIAGEEPELCVRLRAAGWRIWRLDQEMTLHDADIQTFRQWWLRTKRGGYAFAQGAQLHGDLPERHRMKEARRARIWALWLPLIVLFSTLTVGPWGLVLLGIYPLQVVRLGLRNNLTGNGSWLVAIFLVIGKFAEMSGQASFRLHRVLGESSGLIEYK